MITHVVLFYHESMAKVCRNLLGEKYPTRVEHAGSRDDIIIKILGCNARFPNDELLLLAIPKDLFVSLNATSDWINAASQLFGIPVGTVAISYNKEDIRWPLINDSDMLNDLVMLDIIDVVKDVMRYIRISAHVSFDNLVDRALADCSKKDFPNLNLSK